MSRAGKGPIVVIAAIAAAGAAAIAAWLLWWTPRQERAEARAQVTAWETRWAEARRCLLGDPPLASDPADALALAELATGSLKPSIGDCTKPVGRLVRPEGAAAPIAAVERAWGAVEAAIPALANAYAMRISARADDIDRRVVDLGVAISALDGAHDELRAAAGLPPVDRAGRLAPARLPAPTPLAAGGEPVTASRARVMAGVVRGEAFGEAQAAFALTGAGADRARALAWPADAVPSLPGGAWLATTIPARQLDPRAPELAYTILAAPAGGPIDAAAATVVATPAPPHVAVGALGDGDTRAIVLVPEEPSRSPFALAVSTDAGRTWSVRPAPPIEQPGEVLEAPFDVATGAIDVIVRVGPPIEVWDSARPQALYYRLEAARPAELPAPVTSELLVGIPCRAGAALWWSDPHDGVYRIAAGEATRADPPGTGGTRLLDCTEAAALVEEDGMPVRYHRCAAGRCAEVFRGSTYAYGRAAMRPDGVVVYAAGRGALIALWTEGVPEPTYFKLPRPLTLHALVVWDGVPHALLVEPRDPDAALHAVPLAAP